MSRRCGAKVFIGQFVKGKAYNENDAVSKYLKHTPVKQYGLECFIVNTPTEADISAARKGLEEMRKVIKNGNHNVVIMDEVNIVLHYKLYEIDELIVLMKSKPDHV